MTEARRTRADVHVGQIWKSSDPRRLSQFKILSVPDAGTSDGDVRVGSIETGRTRLKRLSDFTILGHKGYTLVKDLPVEQRTGAEVI